MIKQYQNKTVFLVDPDSEVQKLFQAALQNSGILLIICQSVAEAFERMKSLVPNLVVSAFQIDDTDGETFYNHFNHLISEEELPPIPFVFFTEKDCITEEASKLFDLGIRGWYTKPFGVHELREVICNLLIESEIIHKNKELEQAIKRSEYRYRDLLESASDFIFTLDDMGNLVYLNNRFKSMTGYEKEDWLGKAFYLLVDESMQAQALEHYEMVHQGRARVFETDIMDASDRRRSLSISITPIVEKGTVVGTMGIARDVTEQKAMEKEIVDLKNFNESILQSIESGIITTDLDGMITFVNAGAERILSLDGEDVLNKPVANIIPNEQLQRLLDKTSGTKAKDSPREIELTVKGERKVSLEFNVTTRKEDGDKQAGSIISLRDITRLKQMQSEIIRMDRLASLGVLASGIAHEIKNPLAGIKTLAQACNEEFEPHDSRQEYLERIIRQVNRLDKLLKTFFAYARPKPPVRNHHSLEQILQEVVSLLQKRMDTSNILYNEDFEANLPKIWVDSHQMQQVFLNLILNALDSMENGGNLSIIAKNRNGHENSISVLVQDTGSGIPKNKLETIFDPFYTTKSNGLGLGLSIVYRIIQEHDGTISVTSQENKGTTFNLTLPVGASE